MKQFVAGISNGKRASEYAGSDNIVEKEELHWKKRILKLIWLLLNKGRRYQSKIKVKNYQRYFQERN